MVNLLQISRPFIVSVVVESCVDDALKTTKKAFSEGADVVELNLPPLAGLSASIFQYGPVYTSCRRAAFMTIYGPIFENVDKLDDEARMSRQLNAIATGSCGIDIEADTFDANYDEWTDSAFAIEKQASIIEKVHSKGGSVIGSWHPPRKLTFEEAKSKMLKFKERGVDLVKVVERVDNQVEALDTIRISLALEKALDFPFIFLALGEAALRFRPFMQRFGNSYALARASEGRNRLSAQQTIAEAVSIRNIR